ncbi:MAG TPA: TerC family protein, partial [Methylomirabilota bacterium]
MADEIPIMVAAMVVAMAVMLVSMDTVAGFVERHPSVKILALAFLILIGVILVADGFGQHVPKGYIYFAMAFSLGVELLNIRYHRTSRRRPS